MRNVAVIFGTRPEVIKLAPLIQAMSQSSTLRPILINTGQHTSMCEQAMEIFGLRADVSLELMSVNQQPLTVLAKALERLGSVLSEQKISGVVVQGDTTTALAGALAASYLQIPVAHVEAGLRTHDRKNPFPEEINRLLISQTTTIHFAPTQTAKENLAAEGIHTDVLITGNTVVDALKWMVRQLDQEKCAINTAVKLAFSDPSKKVILVTGHRREHFDKPIRALCETLLKLLASDSSVSVLYPVHLNPNIQEPVHELLGGNPRVLLVPPLDYPSFVFAMQHAALIITDSGGVQEEAPSLGTAVIVTREETERSEAIQAGVATKAALSDPAGLLATAQKLLAAKKTRLEENPYGDGSAAVKILAHLEARWGA